MKKLEIHLSSVFTGDGKPIVNIEGFQPSPYHMGEALRVLLGSQQRVEADITHLPLEDMSALDLLAVLGELAAVRRMGHTLQPTERYMASATLEVEV